ncbi:MAG TPA: hypothetical protein PKY30_15345 [Myxococcota bacterium]|nr:hypothetical protein [Myxococcota bacterium]HNH48414.1 hypothetical protein [Myxococcota bacterium]
MALILLACAPDPCVDYCTGAHDFFVGCLQTEGQAWATGMGYADAADFDNACGTWSWELERLHQTRACDLSRLQNPSCDDIYLLWELP